MLLYYNIKPILVFDGRNLPSKAPTEAKRRENRERYRNMVSAIPLIITGVNAGSTSDLPNIIFLSYPRIFFTGKRLP